VLGPGDKLTEQELQEIVLECVGADVPDDGIEFDQSSIRIEQIREGEIYQGHRVGMVAYIGKTRIAARIDIAFGDVLVPDPVLLEYPTQLSEFPAPKILICNPETVIAEKFQTMIKRDIINSRMNDFYDIWYLADKYRFDGTVICQALTATFDRRNTPLPETPPLALTEDFHQNPDKNIQWEAFVRKRELDVGGATLKEIVEACREFLMPPAKAIRAGSQFGKIWPPGGPWSTSED
jgi:hypothetical protein